jgi:thiol:disulfide interchange protein/DsbC/DsbD-like thiol-disulfide interchange protein
MTEARTLRPALGSTLKSSLLLAAALLLCSAASAQIKEVGDGGPGPVKAEHLTAELTSLSPKIAPGGTVEVGLVLTMEEHWHVYWINAGDAGEPPSIKWTLPAGVTAGPMQFPPPSRLPVGPLMDFGYPDEVAFPVTVTAAPTLTPGKVHLDAHITWLVCAAVCLPGKAHLGMDLNVVPGPLPAPPLVGALGEALGNLPQPLPASMSVSAVGDAKQMLITLTTGKRETNADFYPFDPLIVRDAAEQPIQPLPNGIKIFLERDPDSASLPATIHGLIKLSDTEAYDVTTAIVPGTVPSPPADVKKATNGATPSDTSLWSALGFAFLGGILLNLMPCVFPVLFLKGLALVNTSSQERSHQRVHGLIYTLGIMVSFWAIVAVLLILRAGGRELGWGFQLQSPSFVAILASLLFFLGLSMAGQFEIGLSLTSAGGSLAQKQGFAGSFFTGVLATVVATPCMAPLMGAAVGFALAQSGYVTFLVFTALALGLALPYLVLSMQPQWTRILPKPGAWMETLKQFTSLFLFGSAIWLTWVYASLYSKDGIDRIVPLLVCYLLLAIAGWCLGRWPARWGSAIAAILIIALALALPLRKVRVETLHWDPWTPQAFAEARASGRPIFIDFTAAWCLSCQVNEHAVLNSADVDTQLISNNYILFRADWTQYDPAITEELGSLGRSGVPTYVIYPAGANSNPDLLPELLTKDTVLTQIKKDVEVGKSSGASK